MTYLLTYFLFWYSKRDVLAGDGGHQDAVLPLTDRSTSIASETYSEGFETVSEDEISEVEAKPAREARLLPSAQLGYTWTWHDDACFWLFGNTYSHLTRILTGSVLKNSGRNSNCCDMMFLWQFWFHLCLIAICMLSMKVLEAYIICSYLQQNLPMHRGRPLTCFACPVLKGKGGNHM